MFLLPTALIFGLMLGIFATLYLTKPTIDESNIYKMKEGAVWVNLKNLPRITMANNKSEPTLKTKSKER